MVVPVYNGGGGHRSSSTAGCGAVLDGLAADSEVVYVNDGSRDGTMALLRHVHAGDARVVVIDLSRNFGRKWR